MDTFPDQVEFTRADGECFLTRSYAYHRHFPEIRGESESPEVAVEELAYRLACALDPDPPIGWRRLALEQALADVCAFIAASP
jgi:hypothetical protein